MLIFFSMKKNQYFILKSFALLSIPVIGSLLTVLKYHIYIPLILYIIAIPITYMAYFSDKKKATNGKWRTPESTLHLMELLGGWYGGYYAQQKIYHKNKKKSYQIKFWIIVYAHIIAWLYIIFQMKILNLLKT